MTISKEYRYIGRNGIIVSKVLLEDAKHTVMSCLKADEGKILTNGSKFVYSITVEAEDVDLWYEIADNTKK